MTSTTPNSHPRLPETPLPTYPVDINHGLHFELFSIGALLDQTRPVKKTRAAQAGGLKALAREELGPAAFQILETPAPPEVTSTWASTLAARAVAKTESSMRKLPKEKRRDYEGLSGDTFEQEGVFNSGGKSKMFRGRRGSEAGKEEKKGGADAVTVAAAAGESGRSWDEEERQRWEEARQDARRSAAVDAFLRASSASEGGGGGGGSGTRRKRRGRGRTGAQPAVLRSEEREDRNHRSAVFTPRRVAGGGAGGDEEGDGGDGGRPPLRQSPRSLRSTSSLSEEEQKEVDDGESSEGKSAEEEGGVRDGAVLALDMEGLVADLRAQEGEAVARIEALRSQVGGGLHRVGAAVVIVSVFRSRPAALSNCRRSSGPRFFLFCRLMRSLVV